VTKQGSKKKRDSWTKPERVVFKAFGSGEGEVSLRRFIRGQRRINKKLYTAIDLILEALTKQSRKTSTPVDKGLAKAKLINDRVPGPPPGCG
jgi:hypothetical protein